MTGTWLVNVNNTPRVISAEINPFIGRLKVTYNGQVIHTQFVFWMLGDIYSFEKEGHQFTFGIKGWGYLGNFALRMDGVEVTTGGEQRLPVQPLPPKPEPPPLVEIDPSVEILSEANTSEVSDIIGVEEFPLDNRSGGKPLEVEYQVTKTTTNEVSVESTLSGGLKLNASLFKLVRAELSANLSRKVGSTIGETITRRQTLNFSVGPKEMVVYKVIWKQKTRRGEYVALVNGQEVTVPYTMRYDLTCEVKC